MKKLLCFHLLYPRLADLRLRLVAKVVCKTICSVWTNLVREALLGRPYGMVQSRLDKEMLTKSLPFSDGSSAALPCCLEDGLW
jgi:hypothetical protein